ncbi:hypothetical protein T02_13197 [Trichinella nativa]|uniref:Uncharacterized protein n=1 Tax=Trichinella nativa TaxID=6335 RepID=A0A0V1KWM3_9BILA|nr:hypothetical protein T06_12078 [Trichinella sp. T6]KRZ51372.1 hypothetical protein T02_13197 [Trichinella nativa]
MCNSCICDSKRIKNEFIQFFVNNSNTGARHCCLEKIDSSSQRSFSIASREARTPSVANGAFID